MCIWKLEMMKSRFSQLENISHSWIEPHSNICLWNQKGFGTSPTGILNPDSLVCSLSVVSQQMSVGVWLPDYRMWWICCDQIEDALSLWLPDNVHSNLMYVYGHTQVEYWTLSAQQVRLEVAPLHNGGQLLYVCGCEIILVSWVFALLSYIMLTELCVSTSS